VAIGDVYRVRKSVSLRCDAATDDRLMTWGIRYSQAAFCSWYSTGGEINGLLTQLPLSDLNATGTYTSDQTGQLIVVLVNQQLI
jgi:hypothetical protein